MIIVSLIRAQTINKKQQCSIKDQYGIISKPMRHITHQQTWDYPLMQDSQMVKPCNQVNRVYFISQTYLMKHVRAKSYPVLHTYHLSQLPSSVTLDVHLCSRHSKSKLNATTTFSCKYQEIEKVEYRKSHSLPRPFCHQHHHRKSRGKTHTKPHRFNNQQSTYMLHNSPS